MRFSIIISNLAYSGMILLLFCIPSKFVGSNTQSDSLHSISLLNKAKNSRINGNYATALATIDSAFVDADRRGDENAKLRVLIESAILRHILNDYDIALDLLFQALQISERQHNQKRLAEVLNNIGAVYQTQKDFKKAAEYYNQSITINQRLDMPQEIGRAYSNLGTLSQDRNDPITAIRYHRKSLEIWHQLKDQRWLGLTHMHLGVCQKLIGDLDSALHYLNQSMQAFVEDNRNLSYVHAELGQVHIEAGELSLALQNCKRGLELSTQKKSLRYQLKNCQCLYTAYEKLGNSRKALKYYKQYVSYRDSLKNDDKSKEMVRIEMNHFFQRKQIADSIRQGQEILLREMQYQEELANERADRNIVLGVGFGILLLSGALWSRLRYVRRAQRTIKKERDRSNDLLLNILPAEIAAELKENGKAKAKRYDHAVILFTDFKDFTKAASKMAATELVDEINTCFTKFDEICETRGIEKIKTIGDAYMAAGGIPKPNPDAPADVVRAALDMQSFIKTRVKNRSKKNLSFFHMRAGVHIGPVVAGIVGVNKFQYDIWGDTVNTASRMESNGQADKVNISQQIYEQIKEFPDFTFESRGKIAAKGKGEINMYFVESNTECDSNSSN
jgi:class 3 adenylate cyclase/Tfp pilus assembly protein PilF